MASLYVHNRAVHLPFTEWHKYSQLSHLVVEQRLGVGAKRTHPDILILGKPVSKPVSKPPVKRAVVVSG